MTEDELGRLRRRVAELEVDRDELATLRRELERSERELARLPVLEDEVQHQRRSAEIARAERARREADLEALGEDLERAQQALRDLQASASWRVTAPLRSAKRIRS